jgi:hypothetical protein
MGETDCAYIEMRCKIEDVFEHYAQQSEYYRRANIQQRFLMEDRFCSKRHPRAVWTKLKNPVDDHHIFPRAFLNDRNVSAALRDCIPNRTYIDRATNQRLSRRAPSDYFGEIRKKHGTKETDELFGTHLLPIGNESPPLKDDFEDFITAREKRLMELIEEKTAA